MIYSPLRYPGGKGKIAPLINIVIQQTDVEIDTYIEPFAGGAGVAIALLMSGKVDEIVINDKDKAIYSFWRAVLHDTDSFLKKMERIPVTIEEWKKQKRIYSNGDKYSLELGFAAFFLNRTNRSGILSTAGPIGGYEQKGAWKLSERYNKEELAYRIQKIAKRRKCIRAYNQDAFTFIKKFIPRFSKKSFVYFDPPYYKKGKVLYHNAFVHNDHKILANVISNYVKCPWVITYDNTPEIAEIYQDYYTRQFNIDYSLASRCQGTEIMIFKERSYFPPRKALEQCNQLFF